MGEYLISIMGLVLPSDDLEDERGLCLRLEGMAVGAEFVQHAS